jgi:hypothetical protein
MRYIKVAASESAEQRFSSAAELISTVSALV